MAKVMNLSELQGSVSEWAARNFPNAKPHEPLLGVVEEVGELAHAHLKLEQGIRTGENLCLQQEDAVADIVIYLAHYCALNGIDLDKVVTYVTPKVLKRDWITDPEKGGGW